MTGNVTYFLSSVSQPSHAFYEYRANAVPGSGGVVYAKPKNTSQSWFCNIIGEAAPSSDYEQEVCVGGKNMTYLHYTY